jgi:hypothetical protein
MITKIISVEELDAKAVTTDADGKAEINRRAELLELPVKTLRTLLAERNINGQDLADKVDLVNKLLHSEAQEAARLAFSSKVKLVASLPILELLAQLRTISNTQERHVFTQRVYETHKTVWRQDSRYRSTMAYHFVEEVHPMYSIMFLMLSRCYHIEN